MAPDTLAGGRRTSAWGKGRHAYFALKVSKRPDRIVFYADDKEITAPASGEELKGKNLKCVLYFTTKANETILVKTGISGVDAEGAAKNLAAEAPGWEFDKVRATARETWRKQISKVSVQGHERDSTSASSTPRFITCRSGRRYSTTWTVDIAAWITRSIHLKTGRANFSTFSLWDTFRAAHPAYTLIEQEHVPLWMNTLIRMAEQSPAGMPVWPLMSTETGTMTGYHSAAVISEACNKGFTGIDYEKAYALMMKRAMVDDYRGLGYYRKLHYIPADKERRVGFEDLRVLL